MPRKLVVAAAAFSLTLGGLTVTSSAVAASSYRSTMIVMQKSSAMEQGTNLLGSARWGFKQSFRNYIADGAAQGAIELGEGASGEFDFPLAPGQTVDLANPGTLQFQGSVHFTGHNGQLDITIANPAVEFTSPTTGSLLLNVKSKAMGSTDITDYGQVRFASLDGLRLSQAGDSVSLSTSAVRLTDAGAAGFAGFYQVGLELDLFQANLTKASVEGPPQDSPASTGSSSEQTQQPSGPSNGTVENPSGMSNGQAAKSSVPSQPISSSNTQAPSGVQPRGGGNSASASAPDGSNRAAGTVRKAPSATSVPAASQAQETSRAQEISQAQGAPTVESAPQQADGGGDAKPSAAAKPECKVDESSTRVARGNFGWGLRKSFTTYIRSSIARGSWNLSGATWDGSNFGFAATGGLFNTGSKKGSLYYSGSVHFSGHNGLLDMTISNPTLEIDGGRGALYLNVASSDTSGKKTDYGRVHFANVAFADVTASATSLSYTSSAVTLTARGAQAFAGFYKDGESLDNLSGIASLTPSTECDPATGQLQAFDAFGKRVATGGAGGANGSGAGGMAPGADGGKGSRSSLPRTGAESLGLLVLALACVVLGTPVKIARRDRAGR